MLFAVFAALGAGLALPYLPLVFVPVLLRVLPSPGRWSRILLEGWDSSPGRAGSGCYSLSRQVTPEGARGAYVVKLDLAKKSFEPAGGWRGGGVGCTPSKETFEEQQRSVARQAANTRFQVPAKTSNGPNLEKRRIMIHPRTCTRACRKGEVKGPLTTSFFFFMAAFPATLSTKIW